MKEVEYDSFDDYLEVSGLLFVCLPFCLDTKYNRFARFAFLLMFP